MSNELLGNEDTNESYQTFSLLNFKRPKGTSFWHLICILWALNRRSFQVKQSYTVKDGIATNQIRAKTTTVILSNNTVAQFGVLFANSLVETLFCFFSFQYKGKKSGKITSYYLISLEPIHVQKYFMTILFLPYLHL